MMAPTDMTAQDTDEAEWLALEAEHIRDPRTGYLLPRPTSMRGHVAVWAGIGCGKGKQNPKAYKVLGKPIGAEHRAKSALDAETMLAGTSTSYLMPPLGPVLWRTGAKLKYSATKNTWIPEGR
jgi:hypothetical protein